MRLKDMQVMGRYVVTKGGSTLKAGERVSRDSKNSIACYDSRGWLVEGEWERLRNEVEVDVEWYENRARKLREDAVEVDLRLHRLLDFHRGNHVK